MCTLTPPIMRREGIRNPLLRGFKSREVEEKMKETLAVIGEFVKEYDFLHTVMTKDGYISVIDNILRGNTAYIKLVHEALDKYIEQRDVSMLLSTLDKNMLDILNFAYKTSRNYQNYLASYRSNINVLELEGGFKAISYNGIPLVSDRFAPNNTMYLLNTNEFNLSCISLVSILYFSKVFIQSNKNPK